MFFCFVFNILPFVGCVIALFALPQKCVYSKPHLTNLQLLVCSLSLPLFAVSTGSISICLLLFDFYLCFLFLFFLRKSFQLVNRVDFKKSVPSILVLIHFLSFMNACCQLLRYMLFFFWFRMSVFKCTCVCVQIRVKIIAIFLNICSCFGAKVNMQSKRESNWNLS